jgi:acetyl esterase/lipase
MGRGLVSFLERTVFKRTIAGHREDFVQASPLYRIREDAPPFLVIHGAHDSLASVKDARGFVRRLRETSRAPVVYAELPGAQHAFDVFPSIRTAHVIRAAERFADYVYSRYAELNAGRPSTP